MKECYHIAKTRHKLMPHEQGLFTVKWGSSLQLCTCPLTMALLQCLSNKAFYSTPKQSYAKMQTQSTHFKTIHYVYAHSTVVELHRCSAEVLQHAAEICLLTTEELIQHHLCQVLTVCLMTKAILYIANRSRWKNFLVFSDQSVTTKLLQNSLCNNRLWPCNTAIQLQMFSSELQFNFATAKLFHLKQFAIYGIHP